MLACSKKIYDCRYQQVYRLVRVLLQSYIFFALLLYPLMKCNCIKLKAASTSHLRQWIITCTDDEKRNKSWCVIIDWRWCTKAAMILLNRNVNCGGCGSSSWTYTCICTSVHVYAHLYMCVRLLVCVGEALACVPALHNVLIRKAIVWAKCVSGFYEVNV